MARGDTPKPANPFSPAEAFQRFQDLGAQLAGAARSMAEEFARSPAGQFAEPMAQLGARTAELSTLWVAPMKAMLEEQQELVDAVAGWAEQQRELAERLSKLAQRHRQMTEQMVRFMTPALQQAERFRDRAQQATGKPPS